MKGKKAGLKLVVRLIFLACVAAVAELLLLNVGNWKLLTDSGMIKNRVYTLTDCEKVNWEETGGTIRSLYDPMLILSGVECYIERISIQTKLSPTIPYIDLFYTNESYLQYGDRILRVEEPEQEETIIIADWVSNLRIDLGDAPETELSDFVVVVNPVRIQFSFPVVVAVLLIYLAAKFLFSLQETPDYGLGTGGGWISEEREEGEDQQ
mgnify:CR=1 FL=1